MNRVRNCWVYVLIVLPLVAPRTVWGLGVCASSPDGKLLAVGGDNRSVLVLEAPDWKVAQRIWIGARIRTIHFTADSSQCAVQGDDEVVRVLDTTDWSETNRLQGVGALAIAKQARIAVAVLPKPDAGWDQKILGIFAMPTWEMRKQIDLVPKRIPQVVALSLDSRTVFVRTAAFEDPKEKEVDAGPEPEDWKERGLWQARKDGQVTAIQVIDLVSGKITKEIACFDQPGGFGMNPYGFFVTSNAVISASYSQYLGVLDTETWDYTVVPTDGFAYGSGCSAAGEIYTGSLASYLVLSSDGKKLASGNISKLPGFPEYFRGFSPIGPDLVAGITDGWRIILFDAAKRTVVKEIICQ